MTDNANDTAALALETARDGLAKLPILGPALWLYARDPVKKFMFVGDTDWAVLPPIVLDQCRLYTRDGLPYAFVTWALVDEQVDARLRSHQPRIAPHEWQSGDRVWIVDAVAPFGQRDETLQALRETVFAGKKVCALLPPVSPASTMTVCEWPPLPAKPVH